MKELGYSIVDGVYAYVNGCYIPIGSDSYA